MGMGGNGNGAIWEWEGMGTEIVLPTHTSSPFTFNSSIASKRLMLN